MVKNVESFKTPNPNEIWIEEGIFIRELVNHPLLEDFSLAQSRLPAGETTQLHSLSVDETYIIVSGHGVMEKNGVEFDVGPGDNIFIPKGVSQRIQNTGEGDLMFQCLCMPRFTPDTYTNLEPDKETVS